MVAASPTEPARLRERLEEARIELGRRLDAREGGVSACATLSEAYDEMVRGLFARAVQESEAAQVPLALAATGGWGRRETCPYSDIDFILLASRRNLDLAREVADQLLYPMWDAGFKVGHAVRDPQATARLAREDLATATSLLDVRLIAGDPELESELERATRKIIAPGGNPNDFVARLAAEKKRRHDRFGDSLYLLEPNLKHGIGALRDLATAIWAARARWSVGALDELVGIGHLSSRQVAILTSALDFLLEIRSRLQLQARRATDQLTFEIQEAIAPQLYPDARLPEGDVRPAVTPAVEALMRRYYLHARGAGQVADHLLEAATVPKRRKPRIARIDASFLVFNGKLGVTDPAVFGESPAEMVRMFRVALEHDLPIYGHTRELVADRISLEGNRLTGDPDAARWFVEALVDDRDARQPSMLEEMHQVGVLGAVMPEFAPCTCRVQHDLYHVYTVDQHQLYAVAMLKRMARGELAAEFPLAKEALEAVGRRVSLYLATLLHDVGKPLGKGHSEKGARLSGIIGRRLGLSGAELERTEFLVREHLTMAHISQRRDLADPDVIRKFAERVGDEATLAELYLLTLCDTEMTAPGNLNAWKDQLLGELYRRTRDFFRGAEGAELADPAAQARKTRERVVEMMTRDLSPEERSAAAPRLEAFCARLDQRFLTALSPRQIARHLRLVERREESGAPVEISVTPYPMKGHTEMALVADDTAGLLADITGVLTANRVSIDSAVVSTRDPAEAEPASTPLALDLFLVRDRYGKAVPKADPRWERIRGDLEKVLTSDRSRFVVTELISERRRPSGLKPRVTPGVPTTIEIVNDASELFTVVEVYTRDRVGVLHAITRTLAELGLDIHLAKVSTEGEKVADVFYVAWREDGSKVTESEAVERIEDSLVVGLAEVEGALGSDAT